MDEIVEQIRTGEARAGMVIAIDVTAAQGNILLPRGAVLRDTLLATLRRHNIARLSIVPPAQPGEADPRIAVVRERLEWLFRKHGDSAIMRRLELAVLDYRSGK